MMDELDRASFWWINVPGPHGAVRAAVASLAAARTVLLITPQDISWEDTMRGVLEEQFKSRTGAYDMIVTRLNANYCPAGTDPGRFLLERYAAPSDQKRYRPGARTSVQQFLMANRVLANRLFWVHGLTDETAEDWLTFAAGLSAGRIEDGLFILEGTITAPAEPLQRIDTIDLATRVTRDDVHLFTHFVLGTGENLSSAWADYAAAVAARLCETDAWLAARLAEDPALVTDGPIHVLEQLLTEYPDHGREQGHPFELLRAGSTEELLRRIWTAQIQILFPIIEMERADIVQTWRSNIQRALNDAPLERFGVRITEAEDAELGVLVHMMSSRIGPGLYHLYLPSEAARDRIVFLHHCRNLLAHADVCPPEDVRGLLQLEGVSD